MRYRIHGVNRATGTEISKTIDASTLAAALAMAEKDMAVTAVDDLPEAVPSPAAINYQGASPFRYGGLHASSIVLKTVAVLQWFGALIALLAGTASSKSDSESFAIGGLTALALGLSGVLWWVLAEVVRAIRDIAIATRSLQADLSRLVESMQSQPRPLDK